MESWDDTVYVAGLPSDITEKRLLAFFGKVGIIKDDKKSKEPGKKKLWIYKDKSTGQPKGDATVSFSDPGGAKGAVEWFNNTKFDDSENMITVSIAERKAVDTAAAVTPGEVTLGEVTPGAVVATATLGAGAGAGAGMVGTAEATGGGAAVMAETGAAAAADTAAPLRRTAHPAAGGMAAAAGGLHREGTGEVTAGAAGLLLEGMAAAAGGTTAGAGTMTARGAGRCGMATAAGGSARRRIRRPAVLSGARARRGRAGREAVAHPRRESVLQRLQRRPASGEAGCASPEAGRAWEPRRCRRCGRSSEEEAWPSYRDTSLTRKRPPLGTIQ